MSDNETSKMLKKTAEKSGKRTLLLALALLTVLPSAVSCRGSKNEADSVSVSDTAAPTDESVQTSAADAETAPLLPDISGVDFEGGDFVFMDTNKDYGSGYYETKDIVVESQNGEAFNDAVYQRNAAVEEKFNVKIVQNQQKAVGETAKKLILAGDTSFDAIITIYAEQYTLTLDGLLLDINALPNIDLSQPWWDGNSVSEFKLLGKNYFVAGDYSTLNSSCTRMLFFNKKLLADYSLDDPYALVSGGKWTIENLGTMVKKVSEDLNGDGVMGPGDRFGMFNENTSAGRFYYGAGGRITTPDSDGVPQIVLTDETNFDRMTKVYDLLDDKTCMTNIEEWKDKGSFSNVYAYARALFTQDKFLFNVGPSLIIGEFRDMESEFGILPMPKYDETQEKYYCLVDPWGGLLSVPVNSASPEKTGALLEYFTALSSSTVTYAFNETLLKRKYSRDSESLAMLDIVNDSRTYDIGYLNWGLDLPVKRAQMSDLEKIVTPAQTKIDKYIETLRENQA